jgi:ABC-type branched-subunit amino acid transport system permease subunit
MSKRCLQRFWAASRPLFGAVLGTAVLKVLDLVLSGITHRYLLIMVMGILFLLVIMFAPQGACRAC